MTGEYGLRDVGQSTPCIIGKSGVETVLKLRLDAAEQQALEHSAATLRRAHAGLKKS